MADWITISYNEYVGIITTITLIYIALIIIIRLNGLRSFSKMSGHDFAITVAIGSIIASTVLAKDPALFQGILAIAFFLFLQTVISKLRRGKFSGLFENTPILLMDGSKIIHENLKKAKIKESDLRSKLREANVLNLEEVQAVILEATGDISVMHGDKELQSYLLEGVKR